MISDSIIFFVGGNSEQMATIVTGLTMISTVHGHLFFGTNLPWPHEVFIEVLALGGEAYQQVNGIRDMTEVQCIRIFYGNSFWHHTTIKDLLCPLAFCQFDSSFFCVAQEITCHFMLSEYWRGWPNLYMSACRLLRKNESPSCYESQSKRISIPANQLQVTIRVCDCFWLDHEMTNLEFIQFMGETYEDKDLEASLSLSAGYHYGSRVRTRFEWRPSFFNTNKLPPFKGT